jgi:hypothetical protein
VMAGGAESASQNLANSAKPAAAPAGSVSNTRHRAISAMVPPAASTAIRTFSRARRV